MCRAGSGSLRMRYDDWMGRKVMISIIVPVYNVENELKRCAASILAQSYQEFELILVDDGSSDQSGAICDSLKRKDARIRVIHQENKGLSAARNTGLLAAGGEYIAYIDSDDYVHPSYLEILYQNAKNYQAEVSVCGYLPVWEKRATNNRAAGVTDSTACSKLPHGSFAGRAFASVQKCFGRQDNVQKEGRIRQYSGRGAAKEIVAGNKSHMITAWGKLYHHSLKKWLIYPEGRLHEDEFVTYRVFYEAKKVVTADLPLYYYVQREKSIMNSRYSKRRLDKIAALKDAISFFSEKQDAELKVYAEKRYLLNLQIAWYRVFRFLPEETDILTELKREWRRMYQQNRAVIKQHCSMIERIEILVYQLSPELYCIAAEAGNFFFRG